VNPAAAEDAPARDPAPRPTLLERARAPRRPDPRFRHEDRDWLRRRLSVALAEAMSWTVGMMPTPMRHWLADRAGDVWHRFAPTYRGNVRDNLRHPMGLSAGDPALDRLVLGVFRQNARNFTDLFRVPHWTAKDYARLVDVAEGDWTYLDAARAEGRGVVLVTAHLGAFDIVGRAIAERGVPLTAVTGRTTTRFIFDAVNHLRHGANLSTVEATPGGVRAVIRALRRNEAAAFLADYDFFRNGLPVTFFGRETTLPPGPVRIARDSGAQIVGAFAQRAATGYRIVFTPPFAIEKTRDLDADLAAGMERVVAMLEKAISAMPEQWVILQRVWPDAPPEPVRIFPEGSPLESELLRRVDELLPRRGDGVATGL